MGSGLSSGLIDAPGKALMADSLASAKARELALHLRYFLLNLGAALGPLLGVTLGINAQQETFLFLVVSYLLLALAFGWGFRRAGSAGKPGGWPRTARCHQGVAGGSRLPAAGDGQSADGAGLLPVSLAAGAVPDPGRYAAGGRTGCPAGGDQRPDRGAAAISAATVVVTLAGAGTASYRHGALSGGPAALRAGGPDGAQPLVWRSAAAQHRRDHPVPTA